MAFQVRLYLIEILHQTTTSPRARARSLQLYLIEILHQTTTACTSNTSRRTLYLIEILHQTTTLSPVVDGSLRCILSKFYIKPQHRCCLNVWRYGCILSKFYIKPQLSSSSRCFFSVVSYRNSTSNHNFLLDDFCAIAVVSYRNSTSNHNIIRLLRHEGPVVSYRNSTSNHNSSSTSSPTKRLYLIEILHQTTTQARGGNSIKSCILSKFYIKPQHSLQV